MYFKKENYQPLSGLVVNALVLFSRASNGFLTAERRAWTGPINDEGIIQERSTGAFKQRSFNPRVIQPPSLFGGDYQVARKKVLFELNMHDDGRDLTDNKEVRKQKLHKNFQENIASMTVDENSGFIGHFVYTEVFLHELQGLDEVKPIRQACMDFVSDINSLFFPSASEYLQGRMRFQHSGKVLDRDEASSPTHLSNVATIGLLEQCFHDVAKQHGLVTSRQATIYKNKVRTTAERFDPATSFNISSSVLSGFNENDVAVIRSDSYKMAQIMNSALERDLKSGNRFSDQAVTLDIIIVLDYDPTWGEVTGSVDLIGFEYELDAWNTLFENFGTEKANIPVELEQTITQSRNALNLVQLVQVYGTDKKFDMNEPVKGPGGNVDTVISPGAYLKPLPKPDHEYIPELHQQIYADTGIFPPRHMIGEHVPEYQRGIGLKVIRNNKRD